MKTKMKLFMAVLLTAAAMLFAIPAMAANGDNDSMYTVMVSDGYLALRNDTAFSASNEIGKLYTGDTVSFISQSSNSTYWYVYAPTLGKNGYVNKNYLYHMGESFTMTVKVNSGYLALRNAKAYNSANEIGKLYTGDTVQVLDNSGSTYWYVYSSKLSKSGYVNKDYLEGTVPSGSGSSGSGSSNSTVGGTPMTVKVSSGYLALRNAKAYSSANEIGKLYTGDTVYVQDSSSSTYWYVYSPKLDKYGYVNKDYLSGSAPSSSVNPPSSYTEYSVKVSDGYLALRNAQAFDSSNEIGKLYTGDSFYVTQSGSGQYWYGYSPKLNKYGYVNRDYLKGAGSSDPSYNTPKTVSVSDGYLALRSAQAFDSSNEIGKLYSGDTVYVQSAGSGQYWYVYSSTLGKYGYVNKDYLY